MSENKMSSDSRNFYRSDAVDISETREGIEGKK
jgi:hypothetical protein